MKIDLLKVSGPSTTALVKLVRNGDIRVGVLGEVFKCLGCKIDDIIDIIPDKEVW